MKKLILLVLSATTLLIACKKDADKKGDLQNHQYTAKSLMKSVALQQFEPNTMTWAELTVGTDQEDVGYRKAQLYLSIGLTEIVKDSTIADWLTRQTLTAEDNVIHFDALFTQFPGTKQILESVPDPLGEMDNYSFEQVQALMQYDTFNIKASIFLANDSIADPTYKPICVGGFDLDMGEQDTHPSDVVLGWHLNNNNVVSKISLWEEVAKAQPAPVFAIDGRATNLGNFSKTVTTTEAEPEEFVFSDNTDYRIEITKYRINHRYDASNKSEVYVAGVCSFNDGFQGKRNFIKHSCSPGIKMESKVIDKVHKNDLNKVRTSNSYFARYYTPYPMNLDEGEYDELRTGPSAYINRKWITYNTFEYDWFASKKPLSPNLVFITGAGGFTLKLDLKGNMSGYDEWYLFPPSWKSYPPYLSAWPFLNLPRPYIGWSRYASSGKGELEIKSVNWCYY